MGNHPGRWRLAVAPVAVSLLITGCGAAKPEKLKLDKGQKRIARIICRVAKEEKASSKVRLAAVEAALVESNMRNLDHGHASSLGVFQQQSGWGGAKQRTDPAWATRKFISAARKKDSPKYDAGTLAAEVQRPASEYRGRYADREGHARYVIQTYC